MYLSVRSAVLGEHGDGQFPCPSCGNIGGMSLKDWPGVDKARHSSSKPIVMFIRVLAYHRLDGSVA